MNIFKKISKLLAGTAVEQEPANRDIPVFYDEGAQKYRYYLRFTGDVQGVGFRFEMYYMAEKIGVTGWSKNLPDESVEAEVQGTMERINYLIDFMHSIKRIHISQCEKKEIPIKKDEDAFIPIY